MATPLRKFSDGARLVSRSLPEIREETEDALLRIRRAHRDEVRIGDEPLSLTSLVNCVILWFLQQTHSTQDRIVLGAAPQLDELLASPVKQEIVPGADVNQGEIVTDQPASRKRRHQA
jgi:hypothetical protein